MAESLNDFSHAEALELQFTFERSIWLRHKAVDERADHMDPTAKQERKEAMRRIDGILDRFNLAQFDEFLPITEEHRIAVQTEQLESD